MQSQLLDSQIAKTCKWDRRRKYSLNESAFDYINEESAYWIGFLMADGCITNKGVVRLMLAERDAAHVEAFKHFLNSTHKIAIVNNQIGFSKKLRADPLRRAINHPAVRLIISSKYLCTALARYGVVPRKSLTAKVAHLDKNRHFWRGVIDGDGSLGLTKRDNSAYIELTGSQQLTRQFAIFVQSEIGMLPSIFACKHSNSFKLNVSTRKAAQVIDILYGNCSIALPRKLEKAMKILSIYSERATFRQLKADLTAKLCQQYESGKTGPQLAKEIGISTQALYERLNRAGISARHPKPTHIPTRQKYRTEGRCVACGADPVPNRTRCEKHLKEEREGAKRRAARLSYD